MKYSEYEKAFSPARLNKYLKACGGDSAAALTLYRHNIKLCQKCYGILNVFEIVLRNAINEHYKKHFADTDWIRHQIAPGGLLENHPQKGGVEKTIAELERIDKGRVALVHAIQDCLRKEPVERAWLFGSFSRMEELPGSDIDILVDLDSSSPIGLLHYARMINTLESLLNRKKDLVTNGSVKPFAIESINRDKVLIYERA